jgi:hypothetical protein
MSTVRTAVLKLAAVGAGAALVGGGAVHVAEKAHEGKPQYVKHEKRVKLVRQAEPVPPRPEPRAPCCAPDKRVAVAPLPPPPAPEAGAEGPPEGEFIGGFAGGPGGYRHHRGWHGGEGPTPVPAPPMLVLFGAAASAVMARRKAKQPA